jgi:pimeloyl-ACP methyl ester carboxylesterase
MPLAPVRHRRVTVEGIDSIDTFYREAGPPDAPVLLLPHGYPASSFVYRHLLASLGHRWRLVAPDMPGFGYSATPQPDDFGSQFGFRLALSAPERVAGLIISASPSTSPSQGSRVSFAASYPTTSPTGSAPTCERCTGR